MGYPEGSLGLENPGQEDSGRTLMSVLKSTSLSPVPCGRAPKCPAPEQRRGGGETAGVTRGPAPNELLVQWGEKSRRAMAQNTKQRDKSVLREEAKI